MVRTGVFLLMAAHGLMAQVEKEFIFETAPFPSCHASTIVETKPGEFLAAWFGGTAEGKPDVAVWGAFRRSGRWSEPFELAREKDVPAYNPVLFFAGNQLCLHYKFGPSPQTWSAAVRRSTDAGASWSSVEYWPAGLLGPIKNKPLTLDDGTIIAGSSVESYGTWACWVERSADGGKTWAKYGPVTAPSARYGGRRPSGIIQPAIVRLRDGRLRMYVRATSDIGKICWSDSTDGGRTWTPAQPTGLPNPNSGIDAVGLRDGRIVLVYNHSERGRSPLNVAVSADGDHWNSFLALETEPGEFSYPAVIQASDGGIHVTYTWNRKRIRHAEIPLSAVPKH